MTKKSISMHDNHKDLTKVSELYAGLNLDLTVLLSTQNNVNGAKESNHNFMINFTFIWICACHKS